MQSDHFMRNLFRLGFLVVIVLGTYLATIPMEGSPTASMNDKLQHLLGFMVLAFLLDFSFPDHHQNYWWQKALPLAVYGMGIEIVQSFLPHRSFSMLDFAADVVGLLLYALLLPALRFVPLLRRRWEGY